MAVCQNPVPLVNLKIAGKWMFIPLKMVLIGIDPYPYDPYNFATLSECRKTHIKKKQEIIQWEFQDPKMEVR